MLKEATQISYEVCPTAKHLTQEVIAKAIEHVTTEFNNREGWQEGESYSFKFSHDKEKFLVILFVKPEGVKASVCFPGERFIQC